MPEWKILTHQSEEIKTIKHLQEYIKNLEEKIASLESRHMKAEKK